MHVAVYTRAERQLCLYGHFPGTVDEVLRKSDFLRRFNDYCVEVVDERTIQVSEKVGV